MTKHEHFRSPEVAAKLSVFAARALTVVTSELKSDVTEQTQPLNRVEESVLQDLLQAACQPERVPFDRAVSELLAQGTSAEEIATIHVPAVARTLGDDWLQDRRNFVDVTIGCARLQGYLRHKGLNWADDILLTQKPVCTVLLVVPEFEQHTLGATLLAGQLRAQGVWVTLELGVALTQIERLASQRDYDAILISSSRDQTLELLNAFVSNARNGVDAAPVIIGGNVLEQSSDIVSCTGADFTANSAQGALALIKPDICVEEFGAVGSMG
ncbi:MAG: cobalamin B12-binding domain-containing protein [Pseudomonadota bacterium]